jgi:amidophosphoribosyltransferase
VKLKLNPIRNLIDGKRVVLVDDSIVRGTTSRKIVRMMREAGAKEVHMRISCPPTVSPCYYGVDTPTKEELIASSNSPEEICKFLGADSLGYLSLPALRKAVNDTTGEFCSSCYTGNYPTDLVQLEVREGASNGKPQEELRAIANTIDAAPVERPVTVEHES